MGPGLKLRMGLGSKIKVEAKSKLKVWPGCLLFPVLYLLGGIRVFRVSLELFLSIVQAVPLKLSYLISIEYYTLLWSESGRRGRSGRAITCGPPIAGLVALHTI
ncbi:hypothetical protein EVAR_95362_1 [Eumeta japonica]|uniref:Uncharacterized protein n=1 Tax=Eumeta variegata TaxID=151549 RepID=A0A4C1U9C3_EUMVA|nr:hypothetical protein EVAR_95362_1 [Eumeta japonica]